MGEARTRPYPRQRGVTAMDEIFRRPGPEESCLLCGAKADTLGVFVPDDPQAFGAPEGARRLVRYCLCKKCRSDFVAWLESRSTRI